MRPINRTGPWATRQDPTPDGYTRARPGADLDTLRDTRPHWIIRFIVGVYLAYHGFSVVGSLARERDWGADMRTKTRTYERALGIHQNWSMFAPNAPRSSVWMEVEAETDQDETLVLQPPLGQVLPGPVEWHYRRLGKLERLGVKKSHSDIRRALTRTWCRRMHEDERPITAVRILQYWQPTPTMSQRRRGRKPDVKHKVRQELKCRL